MSTGIALLIGFTGTASGVLFAWLHGRHLLRRPFPEDGNDSAWWAEWAIGTGVALALNAAGWLVALAATS